MTFIQTICFLEHSHACPSTEIRHIKFHIYSLACYYIYLRCFANTLLHFFMKSTFHSFAVISQTFIAHSTDKVTSCRYKLKLHLHLHIIFRPFQLVCVVNCIIVCVLSLFSLVIKKQSHYYRSQCQTTDGDNLEHLLPACSLTSPL